MNKKNYICNSITLLCLLISIIFLYKFNTIDTLQIPLYVYSLLISLTIVMWYKRNDINRFQFLYNVLFLLLFLGSVFIILSFGYSMITCMLSTTCSNSWDTRGLWILLVGLFTLLILHIVDFNQPKKMTHHILTWIISLTFIMIFLRYNYDIDFIHNYIYQNQYELENSYIYVTQNYIYFDIMYISLLLHYFLNKENTRL